MGGIPSKSISGKNLIAEAEVKYPGYFVNDAVTHEDLRYACQSWALIIEDQGEKYLANKAEIGTYCFTWFYTLFYCHLFEVAPETKRLFKKEIDQQGKMIGNADSHKIFFLDMILL